ncbi:hypothetical protein U1Q18_021994 [Sarracenia purpurea var. burkii]
MGATYSVAVFDDLNVTGENKAIWAEFKLSNDLYHGAYWMTGVQTKTLGGYADWIWADDHWPSYEAPKTGLVVKCYCPRKDEVTLTIETMVWFGRKFHVDFSVPMPNVLRLPKVSLTVILMGLGFGNQLVQKDVSVSTELFVVEGKENLWKITVIQLEPFAVKSVAMASEGSVEYWVTRKPFAAESVAMAGDTVMSFGEPGM